MNEAAHAHYVSLATSLVEAGRVLDAPAGRGEIAQAMAERGYDVVAADLDPARFRVPELSCEALDLNEPLPWADDSFDLVLCREGIEHMESPSAALRNFARVLRPGGYLVISTPNILSLRARLANLLVGGQRLRFRPPADHWDEPGADHISLHNYYTLRALMIRSGFELTGVDTFALSRTSIAMALLVPFVMLFTRRALRRDRRPEQQGPNREIARHVLSRPLLFGKKLILVGRRVAR